MIRRILFWLAMTAAACAVVAVIFTLFVFGQMGGFQ